MADTETTPTTRRKGTPFYQSVLLKTLVIAGEFLIVVLMLVLANRSTDYAEQYLGGGLALIAIMNFVVFYQSDVAEGRTAAMRRALAASFVLTYLILLSLVVVSPDLQAVIDGDDDGNEKTATVARDLVNRLGVVTTTVVGFYFAASTAESVAGKLVQSRPESATDPPTTTATGDPK